MLPIVRRTTPSISLFNEFLNDDFFNLYKLNELAVRNPLHDIIENEKEYVVELALAGVKKENISLDIKHNLLKITAERKEEERNFNKKQTFYGKYEKSFTLPDDISIEDIDASFDDGILKLNIPKTIDEKKMVKRIEIK